MQAGIGKAIITPPAGYRRSEWGGQSSIATGVVRPLMSKALLVQADGKLITIVSLDLCGINADLTRRIGAAAEGKGGFKLGALLLNCSHSHEAPIFYDILEQKIQLEYDDLLVERISDGIVEAYQSRKPATLAKAQVETQGLNRNRRRKDQPVDRRLSVVRVDSSDGGLMAILWHFAAHTLVNMSQPRVWDPDYPGATAEIIERAFPGAQCHHLQGCAGDVFPLDWYLGQEDPQHSMGRSSATYLGARIAETIQQALNASQPLNQPTLAQAATEIQLYARSVNWSLSEAERLYEKLKAKVDELPPQDWSPEDHAVNVAQRHEDRYACLGAAFAVNMCKLALAGQKFSCPLSAVRIGDLVLCTVPGELFSRLGLELAGYRKELNTLVLSYTNGYLLYIPTQEDMEEVAHWNLDEFVEQKRNRWAYGATITTLVAPGSGEKIVSAHKRLIDGLHRM